MKIMFTISQLGGGGAERVISILSGKFYEQGYDVSITTLLDRPIVYQLNPNVKLIELKCKHSKIIGTIQQIKMLRQVYISESPDVIISFLPVVNMTAIIANKGLNGKLIVSERNDPYKNPRKKIMRSIRDFLYHFSEGFVFQTPDARDYFGQYAIKRGTVIANPLAENLPKPYKGERKKRFVTAVRLEPQKNIGMLIEAFSKFSLEFPNYTLEIYGEGSQREYLENKCKELNLSEKVLFKGFSKNIHEEILDAAAFILPSDYEGMSNSMLEALALGVPVISTDHPIGGARMFIKNRVNGLLTKVGNVDEMYNALKFSAINPDKMQLMANNAVNIREQISVDNIVNQWMEYIDKVCG
jgi:glycosyltransferase involved in cell wall biosynthesis